MGTLNNLRLTPVLCAALGAAAGFYFLYHTAFAAIVTVLLLSLASLCFFRVLASLYSQSRKLQLTAVCSASLAVGLFLGLCAADAGRGDVNFGIPVTGNAENVTAIEGVLLEDPVIISGGKAMVSVSLRKCAGANGLRVSSSGEIIVFFPQMNAEKLREFGRGTVIFADGRLRSGERGWTFSADSLHIIKPAPSLERFRTGIRLGLIKRFSGESWSGLALALLLGIKDNLDTDFAALYRGAGLSYILALSGMHLAILAALITFILKKTLGLKASAITGALLIILYCLLVGPMPSLNRAALMYILGVIAVLGALPKNAMSILALSFLIQITITPAAGNSLSFILSYLALLGILIVSKAVVSLFAGKIPDFLLQPLSISVGAFLATAGVCSFAFGVIAPVGIIAGLAIVPLTTVFMIGSLIWLVFSFLPLSSLLSMPLSVLYRLMELIASVSGRLPGISIESVTVLVLSLAIILLIIILDSRRRAVLLRLRPFN